MKHIWRVPFVMATLFLAACGPKVINPGASMAPTQVSYSQPSSGVSPAEHAALQTRVNIPHATDSYAQAKIEEQLLHLNRNVRERIPEWIDRAEKHMAYARQAFQSKGLPPDLACLAFIESGYNPDATSKSGAAGVWQFMPFTGKRFGLTVTSSIDERRDPRKAAHAAAEYLSILYEKFGDWSLAIASYNAGEGKIGRAIAVTGSKEFFHLARSNDRLTGDLKLKDETIHYVPRLIAMVKIYQNLERLGYPPLQEQPPALLRAVQVPPGTELPVMAQALGLSWEEFHEHNRAFLQQQTPSTGSHAVNVPDHMHRSALAFLADYTPGRNRGFTMYTAQGPERLSDIAARHGVAASDLRKYNNVSDPVMPGQTVVIPKTGRTTTAAQSRATRTTTRTVQRSSQGYPSQGNPARTHTVRSGETLYAISQQYDVPVQSILSANRISSPDDLRVGQILSIPGGSRSYVTRAGAPESFSRKKPVARYSDRQASGQSGPKWHQVRRGDTVWSIARQYAVSPWDLLQWNRLSKQTQLRTGDRLAVYD